jgi:hypothetical protein
MSITPEALEAGVSLSNGHHPPGLPQRDDHENGWASSCGTRGIYGWSWCRSFRYRDRESCPERSQTRVTTLRNVTQRDPYAVSADRDLRPVPEG